MAKVSKETFKTKKVSKVYDYFLGLKKLLIRKIKRGTLAKKYIHAAHSALPADCF